MTKVSFSFALWLTATLHHSAMAFTPSPTAGGCANKNPLPAYLDTTTLDGAVTIAKPKAKTATATTAQFEMDDTTVQLGTLTVPRVGLGTIAWSADKASDRRELERLMQHATRHPSGLFLDTAERYGSNLKTAFGLGWGETERLTNQLLLESPLSSSASNTHVATKFTPSPWRTTVQSVVDACRESQRRLYGKHSDQPIDLYQLHMPDIVQPMAKLLGRRPSINNNKDKIYWDGLVECYRLGLVKNVGVCNYGPTLLRACHDHLAQRGVPLASNQIGYSILGRHNGAQQTLEAGQELGIPTLCFFPFAMGLLTGKYNTNNNNNHHDHTSLQTSQRSPLETNDLYKYALGDGQSIPQGGIESLLTVMQECATAHHATLAQVALNYILCQGGIPIPGARTAEQYMDNMGAMEFRLTPSELSQLDDASDRLGFGFDGAGFKRTSEKFVGYGVERWTLD